MSKLPRIDGRRMVRALERLGFEVVRVRGSHRLMRHSDGRTTVVPVHAGEDLGPGLTRRILRECELQTDDLIDALR
jgi:predicted RNA binding protein YcfA (HicA-like mRNA interferase family)